ncbi:hypothetical protein D3C72_2467500 [compost metagenome]
MNDSLQVGTGAEYHLVEREFAGGFVLADNSAVSLHANNISAVQVAFINARRGNPDIPVVVEDGQVAA